MTTPDSKTKPTPSLSITPTTQISLPLKIVLPGMFVAAVGVGSWFWRAASLIHDVEVAMERSIEANAKGVESVVHSIEDLQGKVVDLSKKVSNISTADVRHHELAGWIALMKARHPEIDWADFPYTPR